jgi:septal ring factor EnvC (AmiA/AmiB activator)
MTKTVLSIAVVFVSSVLLNFFPQNRLYAQTGEEINAPQVIENEKPPDSAVKRGKKPTGRKGKNKHAEFIAKLRKHWKELGKLQKLLSSQKIDDAAKEKLLLKLKEQEASLEKMISNMKRDLDKLQKDIQAVEKVKGRVSDVINKLSQGAPTSPATAPTGGETPPTE